MDGPFRYLAGTWPGSARQLAQLPEILAVLEDNVLGNLCAGRPLETRFAKDFKALGCL